MEGSVGRDGEIIKAEQNVVNIFEDETVTSVSGDQLGGDKECIVAVNAAGGEFAGLAIGISGVLKGGTIDAEEGLDASARESIGALARRRGAEFLADAGFSKEVSSRTDRGVLKFFSVRCLAAPLAVEGVALEEVDTDKGGVRAAVKFLAQQRRIDRPEALGAVVDGVDRYGVVLKAQGLKRGEGEGNTLAGIAAVVVVDGVSLGG